MPFSEVLRGWREDADFRSYFLQLLAHAPFASFRWETPPVTRTSVNRPFEFVLWNSPELSRAASPEAFASRFEHLGVQENVISFPNLGKDVILIVPCPRAPIAAYSHLAAFVREAPEPQKHALWKSIGTIMESSLGAAPVWLNTAGDGIPWLHVRLDNRPKYYFYEPYRDAGALPGFTL